MPPRKSDASKAGSKSDEEPAAKEVPTGVNIDDLNLPKSIVTRLAKGVLPPNTQIQGNAMIAMTKSATVFVNYLAAHANEYTQNHSRKTISPQDVFDALGDVEFPEFTPRLEAELAKFNEIAAFKRNQYRSRVAADKAAGKAVDEDVDDEDMEKDERPVAKKARRNTDTGDDADVSRIQGKRDIEDEDEDEEEEEGDKPVDETEGEDGEESHGEGEEHLEDREVEAVEDEALDNGEDSD